MIQLIKIGLKKKQNLMTKLKKILQNTLSKLSKTSTFRWSFF
ncbi:hypothetical protein Y022_09190 [Streptococcus thermophilus TH1477]|nr:hypothetical protein Y016_09045 [Streptococcus thermophilus TH985]EWM60708.1 hypothetical protein Y022_09190 [Streptococcus thermophilus TH1477]